MAKVRARTRLSARRGDSDLNEPTAALDALAEYEVFNRFAELTKGKIAVLFSHRLSTVRMADRIVVLKDGESMKRELTTS